MEKGLILYPDDVDLNFKSGFITNLWEYAKALMYIEKIKEVYDDKYSLYLSIDNCGERLGKYDMLQTIIKKLKPLMTARKLEKISTLKKREFSYLLLKYY